MAKLGLMIPWVEHYMKIKTFFQYDPEVRVIYDEDNKIVSLYVDNGEKAGALDALLPDTVTFGNDVLRITVIPVNGIKLQIPRTIESKAFTGNPIVKDVFSFNDVFATPLVYVIFKKEVVQYFTDNIGDYHGMRSTLYETLAKEIFSDKPGVCYCTDIE